LQVGFSNEFEVSAALQAEPSVTFTGKSNRKAASMNGRLESTFG